MSKVFRAPGPVSTLPRPIRTAESEQDDVDPLLLLRTIWRGKWRIIALMMLTGSLAVGYLTFVAVPTYAAWTVLMLDQAASKGAGSELALDKEAITAELEVIKSRAIAREVVKQLALTEDPEFNPALRPEPQYPFSQQIEATKKGLRALLKPERPRELSEDPALTRTTDNLIAGLSVGSVSSSSVFIIRFESVSPKKAALIANTVTQVYMTDRLSERFQARQRADQWLSARVAELKLTLETSKRRYEGFLAAAEMRSPEMVERLNRQLKDLRARLAIARATVAEDAELVDALRAVSGGGDIASWPILLRHPAGAALKRAQSLPPEQRDRLVAKAIEDAVARQSLGEASAAALASSTGDLEESLARQSAEVVEAEQLQRDLEANTLVYEQALTRLKELSVNANVDAPQARILSNAEVPSEPSSPRSKLTFVLALAFGGLIGSGMVIAKEGGRRVFRTADEVEEKTGLPVVAEIPILKGARRRGARAIISRNTSMFSEAARNLRTSIMMAHGDRPPRTVAFTSCMPGEGKTTMSLAFADSMAHLGARVLCIDADLRRQSLSIGLGFDVQAGVADAAANPKKAEDYILSRDDTGVDFLPAGKPNINPADLFASSGFRQLIKKLQLDYSCVVIDTPPVLILPDARLVAAVAGSFYLVVKWDQTTKWQVLDALRDLTSENLSVKGIILNQIEPKRMKKYGYRDRRAACGYGSRYARELA